ncbi:Small subunit (SSU) processome component [Mortierella hygrophila]|uniref:Small subunit (SSU) processome component n=1 Tax=Mortierella hygrophila TaxID=979708 RepID=A0A9P6K591_9FUNG|nr:Small subunit (SSU) processome component [Mortierella hygrophila]
MVKKSAGKAPAPAPATKAAAKPTKKATKSAPIAKPSITAKEDSSDSSAAEDDDDDQEEEDSDAEDLKDRDAGSGRTMEEKLQDMNSKSKSSTSTSQSTTSSTAATPVSSRTTTEPTTTSTTPSNKYTTPKANDLQQTFLQALHTSDADLLDACLHFSQPVTVLRNTIRRVATTSVLPLLTTLLNQYQQKPNQNIHLIEWIKSILLIHSSSLMTNQDLVMRLSGFYDAIEARVPVYQKVMNLNGRLDLIMNQIEMRKQYEQSGAEEEVVYVEDEEQQVEEEDLDHAGAMDDDDDDDDLVGETDAFDEEENGDTDEEELESDMSEDEDDVSDDDE